MAFTGRQIVERARLKAQDPEALRTSDPEALLWLGDAQREVVTWVPTAYTKSDVRTLAPGTRQTLAGLGLADGISVVDVPRNVRASGESGRAITLRRREWLDDHRPNWHLEQATQALHFMLDERDRALRYMTTDPDTGSASADTSV